jgi:hypothetical protein
MPIFPYDEPRIDAGLDFKQLLNAFFMITKGHPFTLVSSGKRGHEAQTYCELGGRRMVADRDGLEWREMLRQMSADEKRAFLRAVLRVRAYCPTCAVKNSELHRDPCYACIVLPNDLGQVLATVN